MCTWSSASRASTKKRSSTSSRWKIRECGPSHGPGNCPLPRLGGNSTSTRVTKRIIRWRTPCGELAWPRKKRLRRLRSSGLKQKGQQMRTKLFVMIAGLGLLVAAVPAWAHHAFAAEFDQNKPLKLKGTVVKWEETNPPSWTT